MKLKKYNLNFDPCWQYICDNLKEVNMLSTKLLSSLNFRAGHFFTLLPQNSNFEAMYNFKAGLKLPQFPEEEYFVEEKRFTYNRIPNIEKELSQLLYNEVQLEPQFNLLFDIVKGDATEKYAAFYSELHPLFHNKEVYFLLNKTNVSIENIYKCLGRSLSFWHSLCVMTSTDFNNIKRTLAFEKIEEICNKIELIIIGAYDGEGYIFWEKNSVNNPGGFFSSIPNHS